MANDAGPTPIETLCRRYGPGRLPLADRRVVATGYAFATAALLSTVVWELFVGGVIMLIISYDSYRFGETTLRVLWSDDLDGLLNPLEVAGLIPLVFVPSAFLAGTFARYLPARLRRRGALTGTLTMAGAYLVGGLPIGVALMLYGEVGDLAGALFFGSIFSLVAFPYSAWLSLPIGAAVGHVHQRAVGDSVQRGIASRLGNRVRAVAARALAPLSDRAVYGWTRYGLGWLPGGTRPAIGAGYAFAAVAGVLALALIRLALQLEAPESRWLALSAVVFVPVAAAAGTLVWSLLPDDFPYRGPVGGTGVMAATLLVAGSVVPLLYGVPEVTVAASVEPGISALLYFGWLSLPLGATVGSVHDRALATTHAF
ncbi:hypothetical protein [Haloarcula salinisoli]|uniref:Uncharacterized protein n=1 Tax=Haloarcula salinisoli TaxID=2487746 RepID=A0A8J8C7Q8_9EURY|nr:hypothetical protein [Halomicroarcula salinisoli]MBX0286158.1 hypothetical protein [Halomicroarcula salinisoli]MBX0302354.1 hypothetical protein [Halomicroarcula salinisoli]